MPASLVRVLYLVLCLSSGEWAGALKCVLDSSNDFSHQFQKMVFPSSFVEFLLLIIDYIQ